MSLQSENTLHIRTPEGISFSLPLAGPGARLTAWIVDCVAVTIPTLAVLYLIKSIPILGDDLGNGFVILLHFTLNLGYGIALEWWWRGQTLGKYLLSIQVMDVEGMPVRFSQIVLRNLLRAVDMLPYLYLVGGTSIILSPRKQRLGDIAANTVVIHKRKPAPPNWRHAATGKYNSFLQYPHLVARLRQQVDAPVAELALQALLRKDTLEPQRQHELYQQFAEYFREKSAFPPEASFGLSDEQYIRNVVACLYSPASGNAS